MSITRSRSLRRWMIAMVCAGLTGCSQLPKLPELPTPKNLAKKAKQTMSVARLCESRGQPEEAKKMYQTMIQKDPRNRVAHQRLAIILTQQGKFAEADQHFAKAWELGPPTADLLSDMGYRLYLEHRLEDSERVLRQALDIQPQHPAATNNLGLVLGQQGRFQEALMTFRLVSNEAEAEANLAYVLAVCGESKSAQQHYNKALSLNEDLKPAAKALVDLAMRDGAKPIPSPPRRFQPYAPGTPTPPSTMQAQQPTPGMAPAVNPFAATPPGPVPGLNATAAMQPAAMQPAAMQPAAMQPAAMQPAAMTTVANGMIAQPAQVPVLNGPPGPGPVAGMPMMTPNGPIALTGYTIPSAGSASLPSGAQPVGYPGPVQQAVGR
jgi:Tfp pilus assembly protein PilF